MNIDKNVLLYIHKLIHRSKIVDLNNEYHEKIKYSYCTVHGNGNGVVCTCSIVIELCHKSYYKHYNYRDIKKCYYYTKIYNKPTKKGVARLPSRYFYTNPDNRIRWGEL